MGAGFLQLIQSRVSDEKNTFSTKQVGNMMTNMSLFHFIHPSDVEVLALPRLYPSPPQPQSKSLDRAVNPAPAAFRFCRCVSRTRAM